MATLRQFADPMTVYREPANRFVAGFIGSPQMNFLPGSMAGGAMTDASVLGVRPHDLVPTRRPGNDALSVEGRLALIEPAGPVTFLDVTLADGALVKATCADPRAHRPGDDLVLAVARENVSVFDAVSGVRSGALAPRSDDFLPDLRRSEASVHGA